MGYRKIKVDDKTYEYVVGKTHTKVRGIKRVFLNTDIGHNQVQLCECCGESHATIYGGEEQYTGKFVVYPTDVAREIKKVAQERK